MDVFYIYPRVCKSRSDEFNSRISSSSGTNGSKLFDEIEVRENVFELQEQGLAFPPAMNELFTELFQFPSVKTRLEVNDGGKIRLLGFPERKTLTIEEEIALMNL